MVHPMENVFVNMAKKTLDRSLNWAGFLQDYKTILNELDHGGKFSFSGLSITTTPGVYQPGPSSSTQFVIDHFAAVMGGKTSPRLLEIGCGSGALSIYASKKGAFVSAGDVDRHAIANTINNAKSNNAIIHAVQSNLFESFEHQKFDIILFNIPFFHIEDQIYAHEKPLSDPYGNVFTRFLDEAHAYLEKDGVIVFTFANCSNTSALNRGDWDMNMIALDYHHRNNFVRAIFSARSLKNYSNEKRSYSLLE